MNKFQVFLMGLFCFLFQSGLSQTNSIVYPFSYSENLQPINTWVSTDTLNTDSSVETPNSFAKAFSLDLSPENSGEWIPTDKGMVWRLGIYSPKAYSLYLTCNPFRLSPGVGLYVYSPGYEVFAGNFTASENNSANALSLPLVKGQYYIVEINVPLEVSNYGKIAISKLYHDYKDVLGGGTRLKSLSKKCFEDINCEAGKYWQTEKRAVCRIVSDGQMSTGTLVANTSGSKEPYVFTSNHTMFDSIHVAQALFYFNYENASCNNLALREEQFVSGGKLVATSGQKLDFSLIRLNTVPPLSFSPFYAGWDRREITPAGGVCIHHAMGGPKQISAEYHPLQSNSFNSDYDDLAFWNVLHWETSTTEPGSSGATLMNWQHRIIGVLTGGKATCGYPADDYFCKFNLCWDKYPDKTNQLKPWLDPGNTGKIVLDGYDPYGFNSNSCDTAWNIKATDNLFAGKEPGGNGYLSGHNQSGHTQFAEKFNNPGSLQLPGILVNVARAYAAHPLSAIVFRVWEGEARPEKEIYKKQVLIKNLKQQYVNFVVFDSVVKLSGNFFVGYTINYAMPRDTFAVLHASWENNSARASTFYLYNGEWESVNVTAYGKSASLAIGIRECYGKIHPGRGEAIKIFPNPSYNKLTVKIPEGYVVNRVDCFNLLGQKVNVDILFTEDNLLINHSLPEGTYLLKLSGNRQDIICPFVVIN